MKRRVPSQPSLTHAVGSELVHPCCTDAVTPRAAPGRHGPGWARGAPRGAAAPGARRCRARRASPRAAPPGGRRGPRTRGAGLQARGRRPLPPRLARTRGELPAGAWARADGRGAARASGSRGQRRLLPCLLPSLPPVLFRLFFLHLFSSPLCLFLSPPFFLFFLQLRLINGSFIPGNLKALFPAIAWASASVSL